jgi:predicted signal transduction protein with EAL and GGDEF domain
MSNRPEPDEVDLFVGGVAPDATLSIETSRIIEEYKKRADYPLEAAEAVRILATLGINVCDPGMHDAESLLNHWHVCVAELRNADLGRTNGASVDTQDTGVGSRISSDKPL